MSRTHETKVSSWGRLTTAAHRVAPFDWRSDDLPAGSGANPTLLAFGMGRSYGDSCLNAGGTLLTTRGMTRLIAFDGESGQVTCEAGVSLEELLRFSMPRGWFLPVTPGTRFVTVGGALANDVHGKNHHAAGTFGRWVKAFELLRSDGSRLRCTPAENTALFGATIGGLGLTGLVTWVTLQLVPVRGPLLSVESEKFGSLEEFFALDEAAAGRHPYTVSWLDGMATGRALGRGIYMSGAHSDEPAPMPTLATRLRLPVNLPEWVLNPATIRLMNFAYFHKQQRRVVRGLQSYVPFFYPLDAVADWNRGYGPRGFFQYQCVVPKPVMREAMRELVRCVSASGQASFLSVMKSFGDLTSPGWLSFPRPGGTLAMDFPNRGEQTLRLFDRLDAIVDEAGGAVYPAKDARLSAARFRRQYPRWEQFSSFVDPAFSSDFWRRVAADGRACP